MLKFSKFDSVFGFRNRWTFHPSRSITESQPESKQTPSGNSDTAKSNQREDSEQDESNYKRVAKKYKCPTEPFYETLKILDELF